MEFSPLWRGGRPCDPDIDLDWSMSPDPPGPRTFTRVIRRAHLPQRFRPPENVLKYTGETNPGMWLEDYQLACRAGGVNDDLFVIQTLSRQRGWRDKAVLSRRWEWRDKLDT